MRENLYDNVLLGISEVIEEVSESIRKEFKGVNPFDKEPVSNDELLLEYDVSGYKKFEEIANTQGLNVATEYRDKMEELKRRRGNA